MLISGDEVENDLLLIVIKALLESGAVLHILIRRKQIYLFLSRIMPDVHYSTEKA